MKRLVSTALLLLSGAALSDTAALVSALQSCRGQAEQEQRLACYDALDLDKLSQVIEPRFAGELSVETERFEVKEPTILRYLSDGAIFVLSLHDHQGAIVQNLHIGGGGEDTYLINEAGEYYLRVNGSTTWRIWLEPQS